MTKSTVLWALASLWLAFSGLATAMTGDLNGDGRVDVADALRIDEMLAGNLAVEALADVDGDGLVTAVDSWLIHQAALGVPLPEFLAMATIGPAGGEVAGGGGRLLVPPGAVADSATISILRDVSGQGLDEGEVEGDVLLLSGLPRAATGVQVRLPLPATGTPDQWTLAGGEFLYARSSSAFAWRWRLLDRSVVTVEGNELVYTLPPLPEEPDAGARDGEAPPPPVFNLLKIAVAVNPADTGTRYFNRIYTSAHFKVYAPDQADEDLIIAIESLPNRLEVVYNLTKGLGFPLDSHAEWFPLDVYVKKGQKEDGLFVDCTFYGKYISIRSGLLAADQLAVLKATLAHEFLHFIQSHYGATIKTSGWVDDAMAVWFEKTAVGDPAYVPNVYTAPSAPLSGLHRTVQKEFQWTINPRNLYNWQASWSRAQDHGYQMSAFFEYLSQRYDWDAEFVYKFYQKIQADVHPVRALDEVLGSSTSFDLDRIFDYFCGDYLQARHPYRAANPQASKIFSTEGGRGVRHMIDKNTAEPFEQFEDILTVQELGAGMVQYKLVEPRKILPKGTVLYAEVEAEHCDRLYGIAEYTVAKQLVQEFVTGTYDSDAKKYTIELPVNVEANQVLLHLLSYKAEEIVGDGYTDSFQVKVKSALQGRLFIPPFIAFHRIKEQSKHQVFANAILDVEPGRLENFAVFGYPLSYSDYDYTYSMFNKYATVVRKDDLPLTMKLYSDLQVTTIEPFTIVVKYPSSTSPDGFATFDWKHHDVPAPSGSGSPTIAIMAYHGPEDGISLTLDPYRIFNVEVPQEELQEANGGVELVVPPPISGYLYMLSVFAKYDTVLDGRSALQLLYFVSIFPPAEATDE